MQTDLGLSIDRGKNCVHCLCLFIFSLALVLLYTLFVPEISAYQRFEKGSIESCEVNDIPPFVPIDPSLCCISNFSQLVLNVRNIISLITFLFFER